MPARRILRPLPVNCCKLEIWLCTQRLRLAQQATCIHPSSSLAESAFYGLSAARNFQLLLSERVRTETFIDREASNTRTLQMKEFRRDVKYNRTVLNRKIQTRTLVTLPKPFHLLDEAESFTRLNRSLTLGSYRRS
jgi:hypothetical protein